MDAARNSQRPGAESPALHAAPAVALPVVTDFARMIVPQKKIRFEQQDDGYWIAQSDLLPGVQAAARDKWGVLVRFQQAAKAHLRALLDTGRPIPEPFRSKFVLTA
jgi:predicted RNase H-like HicB family nuclease